MEIQKWFTVKACITRDGRLGKKEIFPSLAFIHLYTEKFRELNLGKFCFYSNLQLYAFLALWRVINVPKDSYIVFSLWVDVFDLKWKVER